MSEDRTQPASPRRRQFAREQGQAAHSPELTAAIGWLVAVALLTAFQTSLMASLVELVRTPLAGPGVRLDDAVDLARLVRTAALGIASPVGAVLAGFAVGAFAAHQLQTRGLFAPGLIAPDGSRLWRPGRGEGLGAKVERCVWSVVKTVVLIGVVIWGVRSRWEVLQGLSFLDVSDAARGGFVALLTPAWALAAAMLAVGIVDYGLRHARFEAMLRTTQDEHREDLRTVEGDPATRASRRRMARAWREGAAELLEGSTLVLTGDGGLVVVLAGGPPPGKVFGRAAARGKSAAPLRAAVARAKLPTRQAPALALKIVSRPAGSSRGAIADPLLIAQLRSVWQAV